jgi:hypothetical protein
VGGDQFTRVRVSDQIKNSFDILILQEKKKILKYVVLNCV